MRTFDIHRFGQTLKCLVVSDRRQLLKWLGGSTTGLLLAQLFATRVVENSRPLVEYDVRVENAVGFCTFLLFMLTYVFASSIFSNMKETRQRTQFLMLPASNAEKFAARFLMVTVVWGLLALVAFVVADLLRMLIDALTADRAVLSGVVVLFRNALPHRGYADVYTYWVGMSLLGSILLLLHACYLLGGTLFRRAQFVLTSIVIFLVFVVWLNIANTLHLRLGIQISVTDTVVHTYISPWIYVTIAVFVVISVMFYWLSYRLFKRMQVINNKWLNV